MASYFDLTGYINPYFNLLSGLGWFCFVLYFLNSRHPSRLHLSKQATMSQEKAQRILLFLRQGGKKTAKLE